MNMTVEHWSAWAPGLNTVDDWLHWGAQPHAEKTMGKVHSTKISPKLRRRSSHLTKMAVEVVDPKIVDTVDFTIFASQHGDVDCSLKLLKDLADQETLSPTQFVQSVHNAPLGVFSIIYQLTHNMTSLAAGDKTFEMALLEAYTWLSLHEDSRVLLVMFDEYIPLDYEALNVQSDYQYALAVTLTNKTVSGVPVSMPSSLASLHNPSSLPQALLFLAWLLQKHVPHVSQAMANCSDQEVVDVV